MCNEVNKNINFVKTILFDKQCFHKYFKIEDDIIGNYYPTCCFKNDNCSLKCSKCYIYKEESSVGEEYSIDNKNSNQYYVIETCGIIFKTKNFKIVDDEEKEGIILE